MCTCLYMCHIYICVRVGVCFVCVCAGGEAIWGHQRTLFIILSAIFYWDKVSVNPEPTISAKLVAAIPSSSPVFALTVVGLPRACSSSWITVWVLIQTQAVLLGQQGLQLTEPSSYSLDLLSLEELQAFAMFLRICLTSRDSTEYLGQMNPRNIFVCQTSGRKYD